MPASSISSGQMIGESSSSSSVAAAASASFKENNVNNNAGPLPMAMAEGTSSTNTNSKAMTSMPSYNNNNPPLPSLDANKQRRRVLLPSLGGGRNGSSSNNYNSSNNQPPLAGAAASTIRRESLDETAITNHTHSSASHFSSSTSGSTSTTSGNNSSVTSTSSQFSFRSRNRAQSGGGGGGIGIGSSNNNINNAVSATTSATTTGASINNNNYSGNDGENTATSLSSSIISHTKSSSTGNERVLRYGETIDSLFCLVDNNKKNNGNDNIGFKEEEGDRMHRNLCHEICMGSKGNDAFAWVEALELSLSRAAGKVGRDVGRGNGEEEEGVEIISDIGKRIIQLHRRATSRFKLTSEKDTLHHKPVLQLWLLYSLVLLKYGTNNNNNGHKSTNDAKQTLRHVQRLYFSTCGKEFYTALIRVVQEEQVARLVGVNNCVGMLGGCDEDMDVDTVIASWQRCLEQGGTIVKIVRDQMTRLEKERLLDNSENGSHPGTLQSAAVAGVDGSVGVSGIRAATSTSSKVMAPVRLISLPQLNPKKAEKRSLATNEAGREPVIAPDVPENPLLEPTTPLMDANVSCPPSTNNNGGISSSSIEPSSSIRAKIASRKKLKSTDRLTPYRTRKSTREVGGGSGGVRAILSQTLEEENESDDSSNNDADTSYITAKRSAESCASSIVTAKRSADSCRSMASSTKDIPLFQYISPIDQEPTTSVKDMDLDYLLNWDPTKRDTSKKRVTIAEDAIKEKVAKKAVVLVPKITRNDLGYMMDWNPFEKPEKKPHDVGSSGSSSSSSGVPVVQRPTSQGSNVGNNMSTIDEATEVSVTLDQGGNNGATSQSQASGSSHETNEKDNAKMRNNSILVGTASAETSDDHPSRNEDEKSSNPASQEDMISTSGFERSFLHLIENKNIIRVENEPYAKLGVIGKGGSCKVYRALSRDCDVVALKKVKIEGLNKAAIDGYANEIALLKRLKGNPAIIQLYSAEVDLERKSILLVMELGEVDLNYVLRQQELMAANQQGRGAGRSSLNMNFIRLTWQQMLTAVHSIHEERIIHSDLKPANFLFVRGALKLIDFGIAKAIEREDTTNIYRETLSGTLSYMSPEAIMDTSTNAKGVRVNKCGRPSDIWSLGCILYQMVYGKTPFADCHGIPQKVLAITNVNHEIPFPDSVDESAISAMKLCLQRNPKLRPPIVGANGLLNDHCFLHGRKKV